MHVAMGRWDETMCIARWSHAEVCRGEERMQREMRSKKKHAGQGDLRWHTRSSVKDGLGATWGYMGGWAIQGSRTARTCCYNKLAIYGVKCVELDDEGSRTLINPALRLG